jgi:hypothetical protein
MKRLKLVFASRLALAAVLFFPQYGATAQEAAATTAAEAFEVPPTFSASQYLRPELLRGAHHRVRDHAPSDGYLIQYTVDSDFGVYQCFGTRELERCVSEIHAIAQLVEVSKGDLFAKGLKNSLAAPVDAVKHIVKDPVGSVKAVPRTVGHFFAKVGSAVEHTSKRIGKRITGESDDPAEPGKALGNSLKDLAGFQKAKLDTARQLHVDPYSDNVRLQQEMEKVTWAFFAGGLPLHIGAVAVSGGASAALTATKTVGLPEDIYEHTPNELALIDGRSLAAMGIDQAMIDSILLNPRISVAARHRTVTGLEVLPACPGRAEVVALLARSDVTFKARFLADVIDMFVARHRAAPYKAISVRGRLPIGVLADGSMQVAAPVDYISWTAEMGTFAMRDDFGTAGKHLVTDASLSKIASAKLVAAGWQIEKAGE